MLVVRIFRLFFLPWHSVCNGCVEWVDLCELHLQNMWIKACRNCYACVDVDVVLFRFEFMFFAHDFFPLFTESVMVCVYCIMLVLRFFLQSMLLSIFTIAVIVIDSVLVSTFSFQSFRLLCSICILYKTSKICVDIE